MTEGGSCGPRNWTLTSQAKIWQPPRKHSASFGPYAPAADGASVTGRELNERRSNTPLLCRSNKKTDSPAHSRTPPPSLVWLGRARRPIHLVLTQRFPSPHPRAGARASMRTGPVFWPNHMANLSHY